MVSVILWTFNNYWTLHPLFINPTPVRGGVLMAVPFSGSYNSFFLAFFEAKMTKIVILDQKLIVPNDYQQFWVHFEWFLSLFQILDVK